ncbi:MAG TPA: NAD(P)H-dependent oxidoreductase subunit E [Gemmatimonadaceae bacterium]|nr:NAD(P)H-dependent oxidoreductase subunit E [Gemmatimonadaceae bacterium]
MSDANRESTTGSNDSGRPESGAAAGPTRALPLDPDPQHGHDHGPYVPVFVGERRRQLDELLTRYPSKMAALLPALWMVQEDRGWVSDAAMAEVAEALELTPAYVKGVVTFYTMYHQHPVGRHFVQVCTTTPCHVCGAEEVVRAFLEQTGCGELGVTSADGRFTVIEVECLGACGFPTPVMINERFLESVTPEGVPAILAELD